MRKNGTIGMSAIGLLAACAAVFLFVRATSEARAGRAIPVETTPSPAQVFLAMVRRDITPTPTPTATSSPTPIPSPTATPTPAPPAANNRSLRFYGNGVRAPGFDRVEIRIDAPPRPADIGNSDFTLEFWIKANLSENNNGHICSANNDNWINGHIVVDRDIYGAGDYGDYGVSLASGRIAFGVNNGSSGMTLCGTTNVADGQWHHVAVQRRRSDGYLWLFVDGQLQAQADGPNGDISYRDGRSGAPKDPYLVIGAEKHDAGAAYPSFSGYLDELRLSNVLRYGGNFMPPSGPFASDANTVALYHFDEADGTTILDSSGAVGGPSHGVMRVGGNPAGPVRSTDTPW